MDDYFTIIENCNAAGPQILLLSEFTIEIKTIFPYLSFYGKNRSIDNKVRSLTTVYFQMEPNILSNVYLIILVRTMGVMTQLLNLSLNCGNIFKFTFSTLHGPKWQVVDLICVH